MIMLQKTALTVADVSTGGSAPIEHDRSDGHHHRRQCATLESQEVWS